MKIKKLACGILLLTMVFGNSGVGYANEIDEAQEAIANMQATLNVEQEIIRAEQGVTDLELPNELRVVATLTDEKGDIQPIETQWTVRDMGLIKTRSGEEVGNMYAMTAVARAKEKEVTGEESLGYLATAYGTLYWIDNFGLDNELVKVSGSWSYDYSVATLESPGIYYGDVSGAPVIKLLNQLYYYVENINITGYNLFWQPV